jgi:hypothetical protein
MLKGGLLTMIKKQQKWIALLVTLTFVWLLQVSVMPLNAANAPEQISSVNNEQGPHFIEEEGDSGYQTRKKSILPIILIGVGVVAVAAVLFLVVLKTSYDITGDWTVNYTWDQGGSGSTTITFSGDKKSGTFITASYNGTYTVDSKNVQWTYTSGTKYTGTFSDKQNMSGTILSYSGSTGTWTATKKATTASFNAPLASGAGRDENGAGKGLQ